MATLLDQLRQLRIDLVELVSHDPDQEVLGPALGLTDAVVSGARKQLPPDSPLAAQVVEIISAEMIEDGAPLRAADALIVVGQLIAVLFDDKVGDLLVADRSLLLTFLELWPSTSSVTDFLSGYDLGGSFRWEVLTPVETLVREWNDPERAFHDAEVESSKAGLLDLAQTFLAELATKSGSTHADGWYAIVPGEYRDNFRLAPELKHWAEAVDEMNRMSTDLHVRHQDFVMVARRALAV